MPGCQTNVYDGLDKLESAMNAFAVLLLLAAWAFFVSGLRAKPPKVGRFYAILLLHFLPLPIAFTGSKREFWEFLRWGAFGGVALVIGLPHYFWEPGARRRVRIVTALCVAAAFGILLLLGLYVHHALS